MRFSLRMAGIAALALLGGCGGGSVEPTSSSTTITEATPITSTGAMATREARHRGPHDTGRRKPRPEPDRPAVPPGVDAALHSYVGGLDAHDGEALCRLFEPGALDALKLPVGSGCSGLGRSIGYDPPHGRPRWAGARLAQVKNVVNEGGGVRATVTIVDRYVGNPQPSIEDDVVFLRRSGSDWLIEQPSVTIYRAIGTPDPPPSVLAAPGSG